METRHGDNDGSDIFWPGYVDAVTNLVLNLLFLLTIMTVAVFMFALELGRASHEGPGKAPVVSPSKDTEVVSKAVNDPAKENIALKLEVERLKKMLAQRQAQPGQAGHPDVPEQPLKPLQPSSPPQPHQVAPPAQPGGLSETVEVTSGVAKPLTGLDKAIASDSEVIVNFKNEAVEFSPAEREKLLVSLKPFVARGKAAIHVEVPAGFSEAKRMGFYRAMAVRNLLIELKMPNDNINVQVVEGKNNASASRVRVR